MRRLILFFCLIPLFYGCDSQSLDVVGDDANYPIEIRLDNRVIGSISLNALLDKAVEITVQNHTSKGISVADMISSASQIESGDLNQYLCDYESQDGFRPSSKGDRCPPVSCSEAIRSYINVQSHELFYAEDAPMTTGCYHVDNLAAILLISHNK